MKLFKLFLSFFLIAGLVFGISLFFPHAYRVERSIQVQVPVKDAYDFMQDLRNWEKWSLWNKDADSTLVYFYGKTSNGQEARQYFNGNLFGPGRFRFDTCIAPEKLVYSLYMHAGEVDAKGTFLFSATNNQTTITWLDSGDVGYNPLYRFMLPSKIKSTSQTFDDGLVRIKNLLEAK